MIALAHRRILALIFPLACLAACSSTSNVPPMPEPLPPAIQVDGAALNPVVFNELLVDIARARPIGYHYEGMEYTRQNELWWNPDFERETDQLDGVCRAILVEAGYRMGEGGADDRLLLATLGDLGFNTYAYKSAFDQASCVLTWELYRSDEKKPYFKKQTSGLGRVDANEAGAIRLAFGAALRKLLADPDFVAAVGEADTGR